MTMGWPQRRSRLGRKGNVNRIGPDGALAPMRARRPCPKTHGSGYGQRDDRTGGNQPVLSDAQRGGFVNRPYAPPTKLPSTGTLTVYRRAGRPSGDYRHRLNDRRGYLPVVLGHDDNPQRLDAAPAVSSRSVPHASGVSLPHPAIGGAAPVLGLMLSHPG